MNQTISVIGYFYCKSYKNGCKASSEMDCKKEKVNYYNNYYKWETKGCEREGGEWGGGRSGDMKIPTIIFKSYFFIIYSTEILNYEHP